MSDARVVAITGASSGIGQAAAEYFAKKGWRVGLIARSEPNLDAVRKAVVTSGGTASVAVADVSDSQQLMAAADLIESQLGPIDVWVNNAGVSVYGKFLDITEEEFHRVTHVNYLGTVNGTRIALGRMIPRNHGTIIQVLSAISYRAVPLQSAYSGSKYALRGFTEAVRSELEEEGSAVHLTMVHPPAVNTPFYNHATSHMPKPVRPPPPVYQPEIIADAIYFAATTRRREVKVTASTVAFAIGNKFAPGLLDVLGGKFGVAAQQTDQGGAVTVRDPNLNGPGKQGGTHGPFDSESFSSSAQMWVNKNPGAAGLGLGLGLIALALLAGRPRVSGMEQIAKRGMHLLRQV
ncbi:MAG TPA: SDR family oxidoreductase [Acetobacteraceae bacterium]